LQKEPGPVAGLFRIGVPVARFSRVVTKFHDHISPHVI
jgi:hypothetical protein